MDERVGAKDREHVHVLLGVVQLVEAPEHPDAVVRQVGEPIAPVHGDEDHGDREPSVGTVPILARTSHGRDLRTTSAKERVSAVTSGTMSVAFNTV